MTTLKLRDFILPKYFLLNEIDLPTESVTDILDMTVEISHMGEPDNIVVRENRILYSNPSSPMKFLFTVLYGALSPRLVNEKFKDKLGIALLGMCKDHVYADFDRAPVNGPPVLISFEKLDVAQFVLSEIIEPLVGRVDRMPVFFMPCQYTDICRVIGSRDQLSKEYDLRYSVLPSTDYPIVLTNFNIYNNAARMCHLLSVVIKQQFGEEKFADIIRSIFMESSLVSNLMTITKVLRSDPLFTIDFLKYMSSEIKSESDRSVSNDMQCDLVATDKFLSQHVKIADFGNPVGNQQGQVFRQWSQWSMMLGLTEKQLTPMRGSMWPATKNLKPFEDRKKQMIADREKEKGSSLNFEQLLEVARDVYNHNAKPGALIETLLKDNRVWKA